MADLRFRKVKAVERLPDSLSAPEVAPVSPQDPSLSKTQHTYDEIQAFFETKLPVIKHARNHTSSTNSRPPQIFDKHLHDVLKLKSVIKLDELTEDLCNVAQAALDSHRRILPPITKELRAMFNPPVKITAARNEDDVLAIFQRRIPACVNIASTLAYGSNNWSQVCLEWSKSRLSNLKVEGVHENEAIADGFLNIYESIMSPPLNDVQSAVHSTFPELITWEFKNLNFCGLHGIDSLPDAFLNAPFPWQACEYGSECHITHPEIGVKACRMGYDSEIHPCTSYQQVRHKKTKSSDVTTPLPNTSSHILQQAWAEAVRHDTTFLVINTGNKEVIGIRDRYHQTLYISGAFKVDRSQYMKLQTGLYIAAIRDAEDRRQRLKRSKPHTWFLRSGKDDSKLLDLDSKRDKDVRNIILKAVQTRHWLRIIPSLHDETLFPFSAKHYRRISNLQDAQYMQVLKQQRFPGSPDSFADWQAEQFSQNSVAASSVTDVPKDIDTFFFLLVSRSVSEAVRTYRPYRAKVGLPNAVIQKRRNVAIPELIVKEASSCGQIAGLETEWVVHSVLQQAGIQYPFVYGFFFCSEEPCAVLVLEDIGMKKSLKDITSKPGRRKFQMSTFQVDRFRKIMAALHTAGWYHGQLTTDNLLFVKSRSYKVAIMGFQGAKLLPDHASQREARIEKDMSDLNKLCGHSISKSICQQLASTYRRKKINALAKARKNRNKESRLLLIQH